MKLLTMLAWITLCANFGVSMQGAEGENSGAMDLKNILFLEFNGQRVVTTRQALSNGGMSDFPMAKGIFQLSIDKKGRKTYTDCTDDVITFLKYYEQHNELPNNYNPIVAKAAAHCSGNDEMRQYIHELTSQELKYRTVLIGDEHSYRVEDPSQGVFYVSCPLCFHKIEKKRLLKMILV